MKKASAVLLVLLVSFAVFAKSLVSVFPEMSADQRNRLMSGQMLHASTTSEDISFLIPKDSLIDSEIKEAMAYDKGFTVAVAVYVPFPTSYSKLITDEILLDVYNKCLSVSTMKGLTYISHRAGDKEKVLFEDASMLSSSDPKDRIEDPIVTVIPPYEERYTLMKDTSFGKNVYRVEYVHEDSQVAMKMKNDNELKFMGISLVAKNKVSLLLNINILDNGIVFSGFAAVKDKPPQINLLVYKVDIEESIMNRIVALKNWFMKKIGE